MNQVVVDISMPLDKFITLSNQTPEEPLGVGRQQLHAWMKEMIIPNDPRRHVSEYMETRSCKW